MKMLYTAALSVGILLPIGCEKASSTAPSTSGRANDTRKLSVTVSGDHTITQDKTDDVMVMVNRDNFKDDVKLEVKDLPAGVSLVSTDLTIPGDKNTHTLTLKATADAATVKDHVFHIVAKAKDLPDVTVNVKLTVKAK